MIYTFSTPSRFTLATIWIRGYKLFRSVNYRLYKYFIKGAFGKLDSYLDPRVKVGNPHSIYIDSNVAISEFTWIYAISTDQSGQKFSPRIVFEDGCSIGRFCQITCTNEIVFERNAFLSEGILITDTIHGFEDIDEPIYQQTLRSLGPVTIGSGSWIGSGARIVGKVSIGKNSIVAANSVVVNKNIPDNCMVACVPARIIKKYNPEISKWEKVSEQL